MPPTRYEVHPIGFVESVLVTLEDAPRQGDEGAPDAWLIIEQSVLDGLKGLKVGAEIVVMTWLDRARRDVLLTHPRNDRGRPKVGVFATRSPGRPNPIGLHEARILEVRPPRIHVDRLEALDQTPILDIKPVLGSVADR